MTGPKDPRDARRPGEPRQPRGARPYRRPAPDGPRLVAFELCRAVEEDDAYANLALPGLLAARSMTGRDAAFTTELAYGTLRGRGTYDAVLQACVDRPLDQLDRPVLLVLRLGAHQILSMRVPTHAAVSATVELARSVLGDGRARLVNAVLRKVAASTLPQWLETVAPDTDADLVGHLAVATSHPPWVVSALRDALGDDDELRALLDADNLAPEVSLVVRPGLASIEELVDAGAVPGRWSPFAATLPGGDPHDVPAVAEGRAGVQDEGSQLVALALRAAPLEGRDERWLDVCAGPGGKSALLAGLAAQDGAHLVANELQPHRARLVARSLVGSAAAAAVVGDATVPTWRPGSFDRVLADVPCSGLGALRRRPEARWRRTPADVAGLGALQRALLRSALDAVRPGGVVAYVTCSPHLAETSVVVGDVLRGRTDVDRLDARGLLPRVPGLGEGPDVQLWPHRHGTDAMYLALLRRH